MIRWLWENRWAMRCCERGAHAILEDVYGAEAAAPQQP